MPRQFTLHKEHQTSASNIAGPFSLSLSLSLSLSVCLSIYMYYRPPVGLPREIRPHSPLETIKFRRRKSRGTRRQTLLGRKGQPVSESLKKAVWPLACITKEDESKDLRDKHLTSTICFSFLFVCLLLFFVCLFCLCGGRLAPTLFFFFLKFVLFCFLFCFVHCMCLYNSSVSFCTAHCALDLGYDHAP